MRALTIHVFAGLSIAIVAPLGGCALKPDQPQPHIPAFHWVGHATPHSERALRSPETRIFGTKGPDLRSRVVCAPADVSNPHPLHFGAREIKQYIASYNSAPVRGLRAAFDAYRAGTADAATTRSLRPYGTALFADHFRLFAITGPVSGGYILRVQFRHHPETVYLAALMFVAGTKPSLRLLESGPCSPAQQRWISTTYAQPLALGDDASLMNGQKTLAPH